MAFSGPYPERYIDGWEQKSLDHDRKKSMRPYCLITGASEGIGKEFALQISKRGTHDLILVARTTSKLEKVAAESKQIFEQSHPDKKGLDVVLISEDLGVVGAAEKLFGASKHLPVALLINNAGFAMGGPWEAHDISKVQQLLLLNVNCLTELTCFYLPYLKKAARHYSSLPKRPDGYSLTGLMNVSSLVGEMPMPFMSQYAATKAYVTSFTEGLHHELLVEKSSLPVVASLPGNTTSELWEKNNADPTKVKIPFTSVSHVVASSLSGLDKNSALIIPGVINNILQFSLRFAPRALIRVLGPFMMSQKDNLQDPYAEQNTSWKLSV